MQTYSVNVHKELAVSVRPRLSPRAQLPLALALLTLADLLTS